MGVSVHPHSLDDVQVLPDQSVLVAEPLHPLDVKTNVKSPGTYNFRWLKRLDTIPWVFEAPREIKSKV